MNRWFHKIKSVVSLQMFIYTNMKHRIIKILSQYNSIMEEKCTKLKRLPKWIWTYDFLHIRTMSYVMDTVSTCIFKQQENDANWSLTYCQRKLHRKIQQWILPQYKDIRIKDVAKTARLTNNSKQVCAALKHRPHTCWTKKRVKKEWRWGLFKRNCHCTLFQCTFRVLLKHHSLSIVA